MKYVAGGNMKNQIFVIFRFVQTRYVSRQQNTRMEVPINYQMMILHNVLILIITYSCEAYNRLNYEPEAAIKWASVFDFMKNSQSVILDLEPNGSTTLLNHFIKNTHHEHSVMIIRGREMPAHITSQKLMEIVKQTVNLVLSTEFIDSSLLDYPMPKFMLVSPWSVLLVIVTTHDTRYKCDNGNFTKEAHNEIEIFMNDLWQKYRLMFVILTLPYICPKKYVVFNDSKPMNGGVYNRTIKLLENPAELPKLFSKETKRILTQDYPLRGNIFYRFPTSITNCSRIQIYVKTNDMLSGGYCGIDGLVMADVVSHFGFNLTLPFLGPGTNKYGYQQEDGFITGSLGFVVKGDLDISFNSRFMVPYVDGRSYNFLYHISYDSLCALTRRPAEQPLWLYPYGGYNLPKLFILFSSLAAVGFFMWITARIESKLYERKASSLPFYIRNAIVAGVFGFFLTRKNDLFVLRWLCLFVSIALVAIYQSYINYWFTTRWYEYMDTLSDLVESDTIIQTSPSINALLEIPANDVQAKLQSRTIILDNTDSFAYVFNHKNTATLDRNSDAVLLALMEYMGDDGKPMLYVINECFRNFYLSYIANEHFPFSGLLHVFMMRLVESGLPKMYYIWTSRSLGLDVGLSNKASEPRPAEAMTIGAQIIAFSVLLMGYYLATMALAVEIYMARRTRPYSYIP